jgi:hypothetical protein
MKIHQMLAARRCRRALVKIRREFARWGYPLDNKSDAAIEAALPPGMCETPPDYIGAKMICRALHRLSTSTERRSGGAIKESLEIPPRKSEGAGRKTVISDKLQAGA